MSFDAAGRGAGLSAGRTVGGVRRAASARTGAAALEELRAALGDGPFALVLLFVSAEQDRAALAAALPGAFGDAPVVGCTTAGEIGPGGYLTGGIVALALARRDFAASVRFVPEARGLRLSDAAALAREMSGELENGLAAGARPLGRRFGLMVADADAACEDALAFAFGEALGAAPFLGGSTAAQDGRGGGFVLTGEGFAPDAAAVMMLETRCGLTPLRLDRMTASETRMVVTAADPDSRRITELNGERAADEYARLVGLPVAALDAAAFAAHPVVAAAGGRLHPRALRGADADGALRFAAAVEEGMVLRLAAPPADVAGEVTAALAELRRARPVEAMLVFESLLRRREAEASQAAPRAAAALEAAGAAGFSSWGEQAGRLHASGTLSALAFHAPAHDDPAFAGDSR